MGDTPDDVEILKLIGTFVRARRMEESFNIEELSLFSGVSQSTIKRVESGGGCGLKNLISLLRTLNGLYLIEGLLSDEGLSQADLFGRRVRHGSKGR